MKFTYIIPSSAIRTLIVFVLCGWSLSAVSQPANNSPYARYGLGNLNNGSNIRSSGIGGMSIAMREDSIPYLVNFQNPASYTSIGFTAFDVAVYGNIATISSATASQNVNRANLAYFAFGFPVTKWWGGAFGLREFSSVNYSATDSNVDTTGAFGTDVGDEFKYDYKFQGNGGINQFFVGVGLKPFKNFSVGINASYLFGRINRIQRLEFSDANYFNVKTERYTDVGGFYVDYGLQYTLAVKGGKDVLTFGSTFAHPMKVRANSTLLGRTYTLTTYGEDLHRDTVIYNVIKGGSITMPWKYGFGVSWKKGEKWLFGVEHSQELWSTYKDAYGKNDSLADAWKTSAGIEFKPSVPETNRGFFAYFGKMHYRIGGYYSMSQYKLKGVQLPQYGMTLGFGFPMRRIRAGGNKYVQSMINFAVEWGQRGTTSRSLLLENYWNFKLGFTLNDRWFIKRKYE
ncbi:MAG: hypothetical protein K9J17_18095 [Flavobacteriales bacterium]|nr:hypothetical protein [Flavobacteriales bacterium]